MPSRSAARANVDYLRTVAEVDISRVDRASRDPARALRLFQALARNVALDLYTRCGAALLGVQARRGQLRPGMDADLVAFSADPLSCPIGELPDIEVLLTLVGGRAVYDPSQLMEGRARYG